VTFIPEHLVSDRTITSLNRFLAASDGPAVLSLLAAIDTSGLPGTILAQIELVESLFDPTHNLSHLTKLSLHPWVASLVHFQLARTNDPKRSAFHYLSAIEQFVQSVVIAPIASLFPDFNLPSLVHCLCGDLVKLFPHHPILPAVIHNLSAYDSSAEDMLAEISEPSGDDCDFSDSFFEGLHPMESLPLASLPDLLSVTITNPLEWVQAPHQTPVLILPEPPSTVTFHLPGGGSQLTPHQFSDWLLALDPKTLTFPPLGRYTDFSTFVGCMQLVDDTSKLSAALPGVSPASLFAVSLPLLHALSVGAREPVVRGHPFPDLIRCEWAGHFGLCRNDFVALQRVVGELAANVPDNSPQADLVPLHDHRNLPPLEGEPEPDVLAALSLCDLEFILSGRSPLTLKRIIGEISLNLPFDQGVRARKLYHFYVTRRFQPYIVFRIAVALGINLSEGHRTLACDFLYEGLFVLLESIPQMLLLQCVRHALFMFAEVLEHLGTYYYSAMVFDAYFLTAGFDFADSSTIAQLAQRNRDNVRAVFHYGLCVESLLKGQHFDEALFAAQLIVSIFEQYRMYRESIAFLAGLLGNIFPKSLGRQIMRSTPPATALPSKSSVTAVN
jgi:hypothetical protein